MDQQLISAMRQSVIDGAPDTAASLARQALAANVDPLEAIENGFVAGLRVVGEQFGKGQIFLPDLMMSAEAMKSAVAVLEPEMQKNGSHRDTCGTVILGTAKGDIHEIGKNLVGMLLSVSGFQVHDLGTSVSPEQFAAKARELNAGVVGVSALLTTTMRNQKAVVEALERAGLRPQVKVIVGGAPVTKRWADEIGADGYAADALRAVALVRSLLAVEPAGATR